MELKAKKCLSAAAAAKQLEINVRVAQRWAKAYDENPDAIFDKKNKRGPKPLLGDDHKEHLIELVDMNPSVAVDQAMESLLDAFNELRVSRTTVYDYMTKECNLSIKRAHFHSAARNSAENVQNRYDWVRRWTATDMDFLSNCVFLDESGFHINMRRSMGWSKKGENAIVVTPTTRAKTTTILGAISAAGIIRVCLRTPQTPKKRNLGQGEAITTGTVTGHYLSFVKATLDEMNQYPHMKGH